MVNILLHGHDPSLSEMIVLAAEDPTGSACQRRRAEGINLVGMCCTGNEVTMRHGVKIAGNFYQQELAVLTAMEAVIVDAVYFPALARLSDCYHTKFISTSQKAKIEGSIYIEFAEEHALKRQRNCQER